MSAALRITSVAGTLVRLDGDDIDTDRIMPARFLKAITFDGLDAHVFEDDRAAARRAGVTHPFDRPRAADAHILVTGANFGCGSSREHAPQALHRWGLGAVVAESFGEIFAGNATTIGLVCATMAPDVRRAWLATADAEAQAWVLDIAALVVHAADDPDVRFPVTMPAAQREALLSGAWDPVNLLVADYDEVARVDVRLPYLRATSRNA